MSFFYVTAGHITEDLLPGRKKTPGGSVSFAALTARNFGHRVAVITAAPFYLRTLPVFEGLEFAGPATEKATVFENIYTTNGREQYVRSVADKITVGDIPPGWGKYADIVHLGPVAQECDPALAASFPNALVGVTPQGWMRTWDNHNGRVRPASWESTKTILPHANALVLSEEDLPVGEAGKALLEEYIALCPLVVLTRGKNGCTLFRQGLNQNIPAFPAQEVDPTGAGDIFAATFFIKLRENGDPVEAARMANAAASVSIERPGLQGVPTLEEVQARLGRGYL